MPEHDRAPDVRRRETPHGTEHRAQAQRHAVRRWAAELSGQGDALLGLIGGLDSAGVPADLSTRHDEYAVRAYRAARVAEPPAGGSAAR